MLQCYRQSYINYALNQKVSIKSDITISLYQIQAKLLKSSHSISKKSLEKSLDKSTDYIL